MDDFNKYIEETLQIFREKSYKVVFDTLVRLKEYIITDKWENIELTNISFIGVNGIALNFHFDNLSIMLSIKEDVELKNVIHDSIKKTNIVSLEISSSMKNLQNPFSGFSEAIERIAKDFEDEDIEVYNNKIVIKEPSERAQELFFILCEKVYKMRYIFIEKMNEYIQEYQEKTIQNLNIHHPLSEVNLLIFPFGVPIISAIGKHKGLQFAIDPSKAHNYLFFHRVKEEGIDAMEDWDYFEPLATNVITKNDEIQRETEIKDIIVSAKMRFEGQKVARKILFEVKDGYHSYMEKAEKIVGTKLHGVLGLPYLSKHSHILKLASQIYEESVNGIAERSWGPLLPF